MDEHILIDAFDLIKDIDVKNIEKSMNNHSDEAYLNDECIEKDKENAKKSLEKLRNNIYDFEEYSKKIKDKSMDDTVSEDLYNRGESNMGIISMESNKKDKIKFISIALVACFIAVIGIVGIFRSGLINNSEENTLGQSDNVSKVPRSDVKLISIVKKTCNEELEEAKKGKYYNLEFDDITIPTEFGDELYDITKTNSYNDISREELLNEIEKRKETCKILAGSNFDENKIQMSFMSSDINDCYVFYSDFIKNIDKGTYDGKKLSMYMYGADDEDSMYFQTDLDNSLTMVFKNIANNKGYDNEFINEEGCSNKFDNIEAVYYKYTSDSKSLNAEYNLINGKCTVKDAIRFVEDELNNTKYSFNVKDKVEVDKVYVLKMDKDLYQYFCSLRRNKDGILFDSIVVNSFYAFEYFVDIDGYGITVTGPNEWDCLVETCGGDISNNGEKITKIISLDTTLKIISDKIGDDISYQVNSIELSYCINQDNVENTSLTGTLVWKIEVTNKNTNIKNKLYIDAQTGEELTRNFLLNE